MFDPPIFITTRDRVTDLAVLVAWLEHAGHQRITLIDNASTWPPLLDYLDQTPHTVIRCAGNFGSRALWRLGRAPAEPYVLTDPDVIPADECPLDLVEHLWETLQRHDVLKVGVGLLLDDVPADMPSLSWERELVRPGRMVAPGVFDSLLDTTFAIHAPATEFRYEALRTGAPYQARHTTWYKRDLDEEHAYYLEHAMRGNEGTTWEAP